jgi:hypothetical protein
VRRRANVKAVWDSDLVGFLKSAGLLDTLAAGDLRCAVCQRQVDLDNFGALFPEGDDVRVACDDARCVRAVTVGRVAGAGGRDC